MNTFEGMFTGNKWVLPEVICVTLPSKLTIAVTVSLPWSPILLLSNTTLGAAEV